MFVGKKRLVAKTSNEIILKNKMRCYFIFQNQKKKYNNEIFTKTNSRLVIEPVIKQAK